MENTNSQIANQDLETFVFDAFSHERFFTPDLYLNQLVGNQQSVDKSRAIDEMLSANINEHTDRLRHEKM